MGSTRICSIETEDNTDKTYYYHQDHLGSSNVITDDTGAVVNILEYTPYGEVSRNTGNYSTDKRFTGKIYDVSAALSYYGARYYDPQLGRFITADPTIQRPYDPQDFNRYAYARNNPIKYIDPSGYSWWSSFWNWISDNWQGIVAVALIVVSVVILIVAPYTAPYMFPTLLGQISGAIVGGASAAASGGNIGSGMLFGAIAGTITGGALGGMAEAGYGEFVVGEMAMGAVGGAGTGATAGYAGGKGDMQDIIKGAALGAGTAAIICGAMGVLQGHPLLPSSGGTAPVGAATPTSDGGSNKAPGGDDASKSSPGTSGMSKAKDPIIKTKESLLTTPAPEPTVTTHPTEGPKDPKKYFFDTKNEQDTRRNRRYKTIPDRMKGDRLPGWDSFFYTLFSNMGI